MARGGVSGGYVKGVVTYMVMDDLPVKSMSTISSITLLNKFKVTNLNLLEEKVIDFGMDEHEVESLLGASADLVAVKGGNEGGYGKCLAGFMVMDGLVVKPISTPSASLMGPNDHISDFENKEDDFGTD
ncbi:hypothetical protein CRG98_004996 [Punica granatum]|nr:hypothetical protein CRG98_004996 [Punica granatum]